MLKDPAIREAKALLDAHNREQRKAARQERKARQKDRPGRAPYIQVKPRLGRTEDPAHLAAIRQLPCVATWLRYGVLRYGCDAAHVRYSAKAQHGVVNPGKGVKPDDWRTVPLVREEHRSQHDNNEAGWWADLGVDAYPLCRALYAASPDIEAMTAIIVGLKPRASRPTASGEVRRG